MIKTIVVNPQRQDREIIASALSAHSEIRVMAHGKDAYDALKLIGNLKPDIIILDNNLEYIEGEEIPPLLKARSPTTAVVILISKISDYRLFKAASNQISGLVNKDTDMDILPSIVKCIFEGGCYISPTLASRVLQLLAGMSKNGNDCNMNHSCIPTPAGVNLDPTKYLSKTDLQILTYIGDGYASREIAGKMDLAVGTIRNYISSVMRKIGLHNRSQMARYAFLHGLVPLSPGGEREISELLNNTMD